MEILGRKMIPSPGLPRTGYLPRMPGHTEIGNKTLLRQVDSILQVESTAGTPQLLENSDVKPVFDLGRFASQATNWAFNAGDISLAGVPAWTDNLIDPSTPNPAALDKYTTGLLFDSRLMSGSLVITYDAIATVAAEIAASARYRFYTFLTPVSISEGQTGTGDLVINDQLFSLQAGQLNYTIPLLTNQYASGGNMGRGGWDGFIPAGWRLAFLVRYSTVVYSTDRNWPANTTAGWNIAGIKVPVGSPLQN